MDIQSVFTINGVAIDLANETLRDASGNPIILRPQCFAVLRHLIENADRLVTKDALMAAVWPDTAVTDDSLVQCIHEIRRALGDEDHAVLKTVPKRGYRLVLPSDTGAGCSRRIAPPTMCSGDGPRPRARGGTRHGQLATAAGDRASSRCRRRRLVADAEVRRGRHRRMGRPRSRSCRSTISATIPKRTISPTASPRT